MRVNSNKALTAFAAIHPAADEPLQAWRKTIESRPFASFADIKNALLNCSNDSPPHLLDTVTTNPQRLNQLNRACQKHPKTNGESRS